MSDESVCSVCSRLTGFGDEDNPTKDDELPAWQKKQMRAAWEKWNSGAMNGGPATTPTAALVEEADTMTDGMTARIRDLICIVENYDPEEEREDDRCPECKSPLGAPDEPGMEPTPFCNACAHGVVEELARAVQQLRQTVRRAEAERDAALKQSAAWEIQAQDMRDRLIKAEAERNELRATVTRLNRRAQTAEAGVRDNVEACKTAGVSMGRTLANAAADMYLRRAEKAEAERDAQHAEVLRLTGERDAAKADAVRMLTAASQQAITSARIAADLDESRAQVWGLICAGSNMAERRRYFQGLWETLLADKLKRDAQLSELTVTRDLLTAENARLQKERDDALARGARDDAGVTVHACPAPGSGLMPCCGRPPFEVMQDRITRRLELVNCDRVKVMRELAEARAHIATLELLRRGGK